MSLQERAHKLLSTIKDTTSTSEIQDKAALNYLLSKGDLIEPLEGYIKPTQTITTEWEIRTPKPKRKGDTPIPYEFLSFSNLTSDFTEIAKKCREVGFGVSVEKEGYNYKLIAGGIMRRPI